MHATRRALIAALQVVREQNSGLSQGVGDRVAVISFDALDKWHQPQFLIKLTDDYHAAMTACTKLQAVSDIGASTAIEAGLRMARDHLLEPREGGSGRAYARKVVVLLTDGVPNVWESSPKEIGDYIAGNGSADYYASDYIWYNSALVQAARIEDEDSKLFNVAVGLGADYDFMDRMARFAKTDENGYSPRGSGNPAEYEQRMTEIFTDIIKSAGSRLVQ